MKTATTSRKPAAKSTAARNETPTAGKVKPKVSAAEGLRDLFIDELKDIYWAEKALVKALPKMAKNATTPTLITALLNHLEETENHVLRLEEVFSLFGEKAVGSLTVKSQSGFSDITIVSEALHPFTSVIVTIYMAALLTI